MSRRRQIVILWEGAACSDLNELLDQGRLPNIAQLVAKGVLGTTQSVLPLLTESGAVSLASGEAPYAHGVFHRFKCSSPYLPVEEVKREDWHSVWDRLAAKGDRCIEIAWPLGHPASGELVAAVSDRFAWPSLRPQFRFCLARESVAVRKEWEDVLRHARVIHTELGHQLLCEFLKVPRDELPEGERLELLRGALAKIYSIHAAALFLLENAEWDVSSISYPGLDEFFELSERDGSRFKEKENFYELLDTLLGVLLAQVPKDVVVHLVSSYSYRENANGRAYKNGEGLWLMSGQGVRYDELIAGGHVLDVAPTVWALRGEPPLDLMAKKPRLDLLSESLEQRPREGELPAKEPSVCSLPWEYLLEDGRSRHLIRPELRGLPGLVESIWKAEQVGEFYSLQQMEKVEAACHHAERIFELFPNDFEVALIYLQSLVEQDRQAQLTECLEAFKGQYVTDEQKKELLFFECAMVQQKGDKVELFKLVKELQETALTDLQQVRIAAFYRGAQRFEEALKIYDKLSEERPGWTVPWLLIARIYHYQKRYEEVEVLARHVIALQPHFKKGHFWLASSLYRQGKKEDARVAFEKWEQCAGRVRSFQRYRRFFWQD